MARPEQLGNHGTKHRHRLHTTAGAEAKQWGVVLAAHVPGVLAVPGEASACNYFRNQNNLNPSFARL